mmetsp:Transcript_70948/g.118620  ORF Transcript_70948/g.118620 Transcript_70948/m.118620 type:complete len:209 (+) Transcript_70948:1432-2058(+)
MSSRRSKSVLPDILATPMYKNSPKITGRGIFRRTAGMNTAASMRPWMQNAVTRLSLTRAMRDLPPMSSDVASDFTSSNERTVAATSHGSPKRDTTAMRRPLTRVSQWYAVPLTSLWSGELTSRKVMLLSSQIRTIPSIAGTMDKKMAQVGSPCRPTQNPSRPLVGDTFDGTFSRSTSVVKMNSCASTMAKMEIATPKSARMLRMMDLV